jgi:hypothetical protein
MLLVLYAEARGKATHADLWFSPQQADLRYGLSEDTRTKGLRELRTAGLISAHRQSVSPDTFDFRRLRNVYRLEPDQLKKTAEIPDTPPNPPATSPELRTAAIQSNISAILAANSIDELLGATPTTSAPPNSQPVNQPADSPKK